MEVYDDGTIMQREQNRSNKIVSYLNSGDCRNDDINIFVLFCDKDRRYVNEMQKKLANKKVVLTKGLTETVMPYGKKKDIINNYDYVVVVISNSFFEDLESLDVLAENYKSEKKNKKILPIIIDRGLYEPEHRAEVIEKLEKRINDYKKRYLDKKINFDLDGNTAKELKKMQRILKMLQSFIYFAVERDKKTNLLGSEKLLKYILFDRNIKVADRESVAEDKEVIPNQMISIYAEQVNMAKDSAIINAVTIKEE